jgi:hypothetical protein
LRGEKDMALTLQEQETVINYNRDEDFMTVYTADPALMRRLKKLDTFEVIDESRQDGKVVAMTFKASKKLVTLRSRAPVSHMTEEQREAASKRMKKLRDEQTI